MPINREQKTVRDHIHFEMASLMLSPKALSNRELLSRTKSLVQKEREAHIQVLRHLREIEARKLYFSQGFSSLFDYAVRELGYSEGAAFRRIKAMRLCRDLPEAEERLQSGKLSLSSASQLQNFFERQKKAGSISQTAAVSASAIGEAGKEKGRPDSEAGSPAGNPIDFNQRPSANCRRAPELSFSQENEPAALSRCQKLDLMEKAEGRSSRETEKLLSERAPQAGAGREKARPLGNGRVEIKAIVSESCHKKLEELKDILSHRNPSMSYGGLLDILSDLALDKYDPRRKGKRKKGMKGAPAHSSGGSRKREGGDLDPGESPGRRDESCRMASPAAEASGFKLVRRISAASLQKSQPRGQAPIVSAASAQKLKSAAKLSADSAASAQKSQQTEQAPRIFAASAPKLRQANRYIPAAIKRLVWVRDNGCCSYVNPRTGRKCGARRFLHIDHILPFALGGGAEADNLRLLCAGHNQFRARQTF